MNCRAAASFNICSTTALASTTEARSSRYTSFRTSLHCAQLCGCHCPTVAMSAPQFWLIAVPSANTAEKLNAATQQRGLSFNFSFNVPQQLKVGTLDQLMSISEELSKVDPIVNTIVIKFEKTYTELIMSAHEEEQAAATAANPNSKPLPLPIINLKIDQSVTPTDYITHFKWNDTRFNKRSTLHALIDTIVKECTHTDDDLRKQLAEYNDVKQQLITIDRIENGSLLTRNLSPYIQPSADIVDTENLTTIFVVVPKTRQAEFLANYESWDAAAEDHLQALAISKKAAAAAAASVNTDASKIDEDERKPTAAAATTVTLPSNLKAGVVPKSAKLLHSEVPASAAASSENLLLLYRVVVLRKGVDSYRIVLRDKRLAVRAYAVDPAAEQSNSEKYSELQKRKKAIYSHLLRYTATMFSELFINFSHLKAVRLFVEAVLRYGLPVGFQATLMQPVKGKEKQLREALKRLYEPTLGQKSMSAAVATAEQTEQMNSMDTEEFYSYVYLPVKIAD